MKFIFIEGLPSLVATDRQANVKSGEWGARQNLVAAARRAAVSARGG
jgi:hypothetical protein